MVPSYSDLYHRQPTEAELVSIIHKYPVFEWLSFLSRTQNVLAADGVAEVERMQRVIRGTMSPEIHDRLKEFEQTECKGGALKVYYERQLSTLQQLVILHAPKDGSATLDSDGGRHDLTTALLMTMDLMCAGRGSELTSESALPFAIQDQIRMCTTPAPQYAARAFRFYELDQASPNDALRKYSELFEIATGVPLADCIMGGLVHLLHEGEHDLDEIANAWYAAIRPETGANAPEAELLAAYQRVRLRDLAGLRALIRQCEGSRQIRDWNHIALAQSPICDFGERGAYVLNHTVLGRSLFDTVRHAVLTAANEKRLPDPYTNPRAVGKVYGEVFEAYVGGLLNEACPEKVERIPKDANEQRADFLVLCPRRVVIIESKGFHFIGLTHASFLSLEERRHELEAVGLPKAIEQIASTIRALRAGKLPIPNLVDYDWTITPIIPVIATEEPMPHIPGCEQTFYEPLCGPLQRLHAAGPVGKLRLVDVRALEALADVDRSNSADDLLMHWSTDSELHELGLETYLSVREIKRRGDMPRKFLAAMRHLARRIGLDDSQVTLPEEKSAAARSRH